MQLDKWTIDKSFFKLTSKNVNTGAEIITQKSVSKFFPNNSGNITSLPTPDPPGTLPTVIVYSYINTASPNSVNFIIFNQLFQAWVPIGGSSIGYLSTCESLEINGNGGSNSILGSWVEFSDLAEALEFFMWVEDLNNEEKLLVAAYPSQAVFVWKNSKTALGKANQWVIDNPTLANNGISDGKADALRHAYWNALNRSDVGETIATLFANAHENGAIRPASIPQVLWDLQRTMDFHNNNVGRIFAANYNAFSTSEEIWTDMGIAYNNSNSVFFTSLLYICLANGNYSLKFHYETCP